MLQLQFLKESENAKNFDVIQHLYTKCMESLAEQIFSQLDAKDLQAAEVVSRLWYSIIFKGKMWEKLYRRSIPKSLTLNQLLQRRICEGFDVKADNFLHKRLLNAFEKLKNNWTSGSYSKKVIDVGRCTRFLMDANHIITIDSTLSMTMWNRWTLEEERLPLQSNTTLTELTHVELSNDLIFCSYRDGTIAVWDIIAKSVRFEFRDEQMSGCDLKIYVAHGLIVSFVSVVGLNGRYDQTRFCVRSVQKPSTEIVARELTRRIPCSRVKDISSDNNYFIVFLYCSNDYIVSAGDFKIQIRSVNTFETLREVDGVMCSSDIYSYFNGWLVTAGSTTISIWNISEHNKTCQQTISRISCSEYETQAADVQLNDHQLIIRYVDGTFTVWNIFGSEKKELLESASIQIFGERVKRGYQKFKFDQLQIVSVNACEDSQGRHDLMTMIDFC